MADGALGLSSANRLPRDRADRVLIAAAVAICANVNDDTTTERMLDLMARALPMTSRASRVEAYRGPCAALLAAAPRRLRRDGGIMAWCAARMALGAVVARDAADQAFRGLE